MTGKKYLIVISALAFLVPLKRAHAEVHTTVSNAKNTVQSVTAASFKSEELKTSYLYDLEGVNVTITIAEEETDAASKNQIYQDARQTVSKLITKTAGCSANGEANMEDWVTNCTDAQAITSALQQVDNEISLLMQ